MNEKVTEFYNLRKIVHRIYCDECNVELVATGMVYMTYPERYEYKCPSCGKTCSFLQSYPWSEIVGDEKPCDVQDGKVYNNL